MSVPEAERRSLWPPIFWGLPAWALIGFYWAQNAGAFRARGFMDSILDVLGPILLLSAMLSPLVVPPTAVAYIMSLVRRLRGDRHPVIYVGLLMYSIGVIGGVLLSLQVFSNMW